MRNNEANAQKILIVGTSPDLREIGTTLVADGFQIRFNTSEAALATSKVWCPNFVIASDTASGFIKGFRCLNFRTPLLRPRIRSKFKYSRRPVKITRQES